MTINTSRNDKLAADQKMIEGVHQFLGTFASLPAGSTSLTVTPADIVKVFQDRVDSGKAVVTAEAARTTAVKADRDKRAQTAAFVQSIRRIVLGMFSQAPDTLAIFGLKAPKAGKKTVATKATAVAKSKATRTARATKGTKQKKAIKGTAPTASTTGHTGSADVSTTTPATPTKPNAP